MSPSLVQTVRRWVSGSVNPALAKGGREGHVASHGDDVQKGDRSARTNDNPGEKAVKRNYNREDTEEVLRMVPKRFLDEQLNHTR